MTTVKLVMFVLRGPIARWVRWHRVLARQGPILPQLETQTQQIACPARQALCARTGAQRFLQSPVRRVSIAPQVNAGWGRR